MNRILYIDIAKAICIILVVIGHYCPDDSPQWYQVVNRFIYSFHMPLFMFASGFVYTYRGGYSNFISKKIKRLIIPYLTCSVVVISLKLLSQGNAYVENPVSAMSYLKIFYLPEAGYFLWFIWALFLMFVITPLFKTRTARNLLFLSSIILAYLPVTFPGIFCLNQFKHMYVYFLFGIFIRENNVGDIIKNYSHTKMAITAVAFIILESAHLSMPYMHNAPQQLTSLIAAILPFVGIAFIIYASQIIGRHVNADNGRNMLLSVAAASYVIYLFHTTFEGFAKAALMKLTLDDGVWYVFTAKAALVIMAGIIFPMLLYNIAKRFKATRFLLGLK